MTVCMYVCVFVYLCACVSGKHYPEGDEGQGRECLAVLQTLAGDTEQLDLCR